jgi:hypothetical protein
MPVAPRRALNFDSYHIWYNSKSYQIWYNTELKARGSSPAPIFARARIEGMG